MKTEKKNYKAGQKIEYNFGHKVNDYRAVIIEEIRDGKAKFKDVTGFWSLQECWIKPVNAPKEKIINGVTNQGNLIYK